VVVLVVVVVVVDDSSRRSSSGGSKGSHDDLTPPIPSIQMNVARRFHSRRLQHQALSKLIHYTTIRLTIQDKCEGIHYNTHLSSLRSSLHKWRRLAGVRALLCVLQASIHRSMARYALRRWGWVVSVERRAWEAWREYMVLCRHRDRSVLLRRVHHHWQRWLEHVHHRQLLSCHWNNIRRRWCPPSFPPSRPSYGGGGGAAAAVAVASQSFSWSSKRRSFTR